MSKYAFPNDLLDGIKTRWQAVPDQQFELPEDPILQRLLETSYQEILSLSETVIWMPEAIPSTSSILMVFLALNSIANKPRSR